MVRAYFAPEAPFYLGRPDVVDRCAELLGAARGAGIPVVHTTVRYRADGVDGGLFIRKVPALRLFCDGAGTDWHETLPAVAPRAGELVITKQYASAFAGTSLAASLVAMGVDTLVLCGVSTSGCVRATATDAIALGFRPMVVAEACGDRSEGIHRANLTDLDLKSADVVDIDEVLTRLRQSG